MLTVARDTYRITASRADDHKIRFTVYNSSGAAYDVSANSFKFTVKASLDDAITSAKFQKASPASGGIDLTLAATGLVDVNIVPSDTATLGGIYYYDLEMLEGAKTYTLQEGIFYVLKDVTTPGSVPVAPVINPTTYIVLSDSLYLYGLDLLWHKFQVDSSGIFGETATPQAGPPPF